jgi:hypothetical protein
MRRISWLAEGLLASQKELWSMELDSSYWSHSRSIKYKKKILTVVTLQVTNMSNSICHPVPCSNVIRASSVWMTLDQASAATVTSRNALLHSSLILHSFCSRVGRYRQGSAVLLLNDAIYRYRSDTTNNAENRLLACWVLTVFIFGLNYEQILEIF